MSCASVCLSRRKQETPHVSSSLPESWLYHSSLQAFLAGETTEAMKHIQCASTRQTKISLFLSPMLSFSAFIFLNPGAFTFYCFSCFQPYILSQSACSLQRRYSVAKIDSPIGFEAGKPKAGGLADPRLGTMDRGMKCTTDGANVSDSPGYFGHIELAKPVFHIGFITTVVKVLRCVSYHSSKLLVQPVRLPFWHTVLRVVSCDIQQTVFCSWQTYQGAQFKDFSWWKYVAPT